MTPKIRRPAAAGLTVIGLLALAIASCAVAPGGYGGGSYYGADYYGPVAGSYGFLGSGYGVAPFRAGHAYAAGGAAHPWHGPTVGRAIPSLPGRRGGSVSARPAAARGGGGRRR